MLLIYYCTSTIMGPIIYLFYGKFPSRHKDTVFLYLASALMEHFLERIVDTLTEMRRVTNTNLLF